MCRASGLLGGLWQQHNLHHCSSLAERTADKSQLPSPGQSSNLDQLADRAYSQSAEMRVQGQRSVAAALSSSTRLSRAENTELERRRRELGDVLGPPTALTDAPTLATFYYSAGGRRNTYASPTVRASEKTAVGAGA